MTATYDEQTELWTATDEAEGITVRGPERRECERRVRELAARCRAIIALRELATEKEGDDGPV